MPPVIVAYRPFLLHHLQLNLIQSLLTDLWEMALSSYFILNQYLYHYCSIYVCLSYIFYHD